jgi:hypothetical protein
MLRNIARLVSHRLVTCATIIVCAFLTGCRTTQADRTGDSKIFTPKLPTPQAFAQGSPASNPGTFEQQFRIDTGETNLTRRAEFEQPLRIKAQSKNSLLLKFDLSDWPEALRPLARAWVAIGATNTFTTEVNVNLNFSQNGIAMTTPLNNRTSLNNIDLIGCDFLVNNGDVAVKIENAGLPRDVDYTLHVIVYVPRKVDPNYSAAKP